MPAGTRLASGPCLLLLRHRLIGGHRCACRPASRHAARSRARPVEQRSTPIWPSRSPRSGASCCRAASGCGRRSATGASSAPAATRTTRSVVDAGAAFELLHAFALFHDDVMDDVGHAVAASRTTHLVFADRHADGGWAGEARRFGEGVAILVGDLAFVYADQLLHGAPPAALGDLERAAHRAEHRPVPRHRRHGARRAPTGQRPSASPLQERQVHDRAPAAPRRRHWPRPSAPTELLPAVAPTACRSATPSRCATTCSAPSATRRVTGKPVGDDLREGKPTPLLAIAVGRATPAQRARARPRRPARPRPTTRSRASSRCSSTPARSPSWRPTIERAHRRGDRRARRAPTSPTTRASELTELAHYVGLAPDDTSTDAASS